MHSNSVPPTDRDESAAPSIPQSELPTPQSAAPRIPGDLVNKATQELPDNQRSAIRRMHAYYVEHGLSLTELAETFGLSNGSAASLILRGKYPAKLDNVTAQIERTFELMEKRSLGRKVEFIPTTLSRRIWQVCESAVEFQRIGFIFGESQVGKTAALRSYQAAHNHGSTIYVAMPTGGSITHFLDKLAEALRIPSQHDLVRLRRRIIDAFDSRMLLIVDEAHRCIPHSGRSYIPLQSIEFVRELFDEAECGIIICGTNVFREEMEKGAMERLLRQTKRRRLCALQLPARPSQEDLNTFAAAYGLPPSPSNSAARGLEQKVIAEEALGMWLTLLRMASKLAAQRKAKLEWAHVIDAYKGLEALEKGTV